MPLKNKITSKPIIAIARTDGLGDVILTLPMAALIKQVLPEATVILFCEQYTAPVVDLCPSVDEGFYWDTLSTLSEKEALSAIKALKIDIFIHAFPQHQLVKLIKKAGINHRVGTAGRLYNWIYCNRLVFFSRARSSLHEAQLNLKLLAPLGLKENLSLTQIQKLLVLKPSSINTNLYSQLDKQRFNLIIHPGSSGNGREWPPDYFVELIHALPKDKFNIFLTGSAQEKTKFQSKLIDQCPDVIDLIGQLTLSELIEFIRQADGLLAAGTGPLHLAAALGIHALGLYPPQKPIDPSRWAPIGKFAEYLVCNTFCDNVCTNTECACMRKIEVKQAYKVLMTWAETNARIKLQSKAAVL